MKRRSPATPLLLCIITFGIYGIVWFVKTKGEMNQSGESIPTAWLLIVPFVNIYWLWKYAVGVAGVTKNGMSNAAAFILLFLLSMIGAIFVQSAFNKVATD